MQYIKFCINCTTNIKCIKFSDSYRDRVEEQCRHPGGKLWMTDCLQPDTAWRARGWPRRSARPPQRKLSDQRRNISTVSVVNITRLWLPSHFSDLLQCTNEPNVSIPTLANLLIERTLNPNWVVVYKSLITIHHLMCYGNEVGHPAASFSRHVYFPVSAVHPIPCVK